jgi:Zn-finger protein
MSDKYFENKSCERYPCHKTLTTDVNCLFCFCPLYQMNCGGIFTYTKSGIKDCSLCIIPHTKSGWVYVIGKIGEVK